MLLSLGVPVHRSSEKKSLSQSVKRADGRIKARVMELESEIVLVQRKEQIPEVILCREGSKWQRGKIGRL